MRRFLGGLCGFGGLFALALGGSLIVANRTVDNAVGGFERPIDWMPYLIVGIGAALILLGVLFFVLRPRSRE